jgi:hypothetical protein
MSAVAAAFAESGHGGPFPRSGHAPLSAHQQCHHRAIMSADPWPDHVPVPSFGPRMVCTRCGIIGADARPNWQEQPQRESLTGVQWR